MIKDKDGYVIIPEVEQEVEFSDKDISDMKELIEDKDLVSEEDLERLMDESKNMHIESVILARVFLKCYNILYTNKHFFKGLDKDGNEKNYIKKLGDYLRIFQISKLRKEIENYGDGNEFGSYYCYQNILKIVEKDRKKMTNLVLLFFRLFGEEGL